ncbi:Ku protein [Longimicrobium sp.]|uniref:non-homologous end joining protein Ku n=1 Tax=Longimicrobium sp. TaxID=2029185 RepID=UPI003B3AFAF3
MARAIWKGSISFGLVQIPVGLFSASSPDELSFRQLDKRNMSPIGYKKYNKNTGEDVEGDDIVKGYEYESGSYVVLSDEDLRRANPEKTQTVEITDFVDLDDIDAVYFDKPYYLAPTGKNKKAYALLREALKRTGKVGIAKVVIRSREYLSAVVPQNDVLLLEILRYPHEIRAADDLEVPRGEAQELGVSERELAMAEQLVQGMTAEWEPSKYKDTYRDDLMELIQGRIDSGNTNVPDETPVEEESEAKGDVIDIMALLKRSVEATGRGERIAADTERAPSAKKPKKAKAEPEPAPAAAVKADEAFPWDDEAPAKPARPARVAAKAPKVAPAPTMDDVLPWEDEAPAKPARPAARGAGKPAGEPIAKPAPRSAVAASKPRAKQRKTA